MTRALRLATILAALAAPVPAAEWAARELGRSHTVEICLEAAERALRRHAAIHGGDGPRLRGRGVALSDLGRRGDDALLLCAPTGVSGAQATLVLHGARDDAAFRLAADDLGRYWRGYAAELDAAFLEAARPRRWSW